MDTLDFDECDHDTVMRVTRALNRHKRGLELDMEGHEIVQAFQMLVDVYDALEEEE